MNKTATEDAVTITPPIAWASTWSIGDKMVTFTPSFNLLLNTKYTITIATSAKSIEGLNLANQYTFSFNTGSPDKTSPTVTSTYPQDGANKVETSLNIVITFSEPMDRGATEGAILITPSAPYYKTEWDSAGKNLTLISTLEEGKTYTVIISTGAKDRAGNTMISKYLFSFTTKGLNMETYLMFLFLIIIIAVLLVIAIVIIKRRSRCPECGKTIHKKANRCSHCGYDLIRKTKFPPLSIKPDDRKVPPQQDTIKTTLPSHQALKQPITPVIKTEEHVEPSKREKKEFSPYQPVIIRRTSETSVVTEIGKQASDEEKKPLPQEPSSETATDARKRALEKMRKRKEGTKE
jgi:ribosomal protein L37E